jgi:hypothetical protein
MPVKTFENPSSRALFFKFSKTYPCSMHIRTTDGHDFYVFFEQLVGMYSSYYIGTASSQVENKNGI